jgi:hypothetical protein
VKALGIDVDGIYCPSVLRKIVRAGTKDTSYKGASETLAEQAEIEVSAKQCERVVQRIGRERLDETAESVAQWEALPLPKRRESPANAPKNSWDARVAVVEFDGGRVQLRDETWGEKKAKVLGEKRSWRKESKAACLMTFFGRPSAEDPLPNLPESLRNPLFAVPRFLAMGHSGRLDSHGQARVETTGTCGPAADGPKTEVSVEPEEHARWSPEPLVRSVAATCRSYDHLAEITLAAAWQRGFPAADRKAFLGDGLQVNWRLHREYFSDYEPIVDLMHALSYVYPRRQHPDLEWRERHRQGLGCAGKESEPEEPDNRQRSDHGQRSGRVQGIRSTDQPESSPDARHRRRFGLVARHPASGQRSPAGHKSDRRRPGPSEKV